MIFNILGALNRRKKRLQKNLDLNWALSLPDDKTTYNIGGSSYALKFQDEFSKISHFAGFSSSHMSILSILSLFSTDLPKSYLEIGVNEGLSVFTLLSGIKFQRLLNQDSILSDSILDNLVLADCWGKEYGGTGRKGPDHIQDVLSSIGNVGSNVTFLNGDSKITIPGFLNQNKMHGNSFDFVYVDGDHSYLGAKTDIENVVSHVGKVLFFDDMYHPAHYEKDKLLDLHRHFVKKLKDEFYIFVNKHGFGFAAYVRKSDFDKLIK
jgi:predicted O-methyltransferase YrrM